MNHKLAIRLSLLAPEGAYMVLGKAQELERQGKSIIHFEIGQPDFETPEHISEAAVQAIREGKTKYTPTLGILPLREAIADKITKTRGIATDFRQIGVTPSGKTALFAAIGAILDPGDEVIYPDPGFPSYRAIIDFFGAKGVALPMREENGFSVDILMLKKLISRKTKCIIINSPSNPTGGVILKKELEKIADMVIDAPIWVISDEIYNQLSYTGEPFTSIYSLPGMREKTIIVDGFSKTYAMTGWRLGFLVFPKNIESRIDTFLTHLFGCTASFTQDAGVAAIKGPQDAVYKMEESYRKRRELTVKGLNEISGIHCILPMGAFYAFPNIRSTGMTSNEFADFALQKANVALLPGSCFGTYGEGFVRISYATAKEKIIEGIRRLKFALKSG